MPRHHRGSLEPVSPRRRHHRRLAHGGRFRHPPRRGKCPHRRLHLPFYDSLLIKITARAPTFRKAVVKAQRALRELRVRGVKTNVLFLENVLKHPTFLEGQTTTRFVDETPDLFQFPKRRDRATKLLTYLAEVIVNGHPTISKVERRSSAAFLEARMPAVPRGPLPSGTAQILAERGPEGLARWVLEQKATPADRHHHARCAPRASSRHGCAPTTS